MRMGEGLKNRWFGMMIWKKVRRIHYYNIFKLLVTLYNENKVNVFIIAFMDGTKLGSRNDEHDATCSVIHFLFSLGS